MMMMGFHQPSTTLTPCHCLNDRLTGPTLLYFNGLDDGRLRSNAKVRTQNKITIIFSISFFFFFYKQIKKIILKVTQAPLWKSNLKEATAYATMLFQFPYQIRKVKTQTPHHLFLKLYRIYNN